jgi:hypothetical protein
MRDPAGLIERKLSGFRLQSAPVRRTQHRSHLRRAKRCSQDPNELPRLSTFLRHNSGMSQEEIVRPETGSTLLQVRHLIAALTLALLVTLVSGCGGGGSYPPTRGYSTAQVTRVFKAHGLVLIHVTALENRSGVATHLRAIMRSTGGGYVVVFVYKSSKEANMAATLLGKQYSVKQRRTYRAVIVVNVFATVILFDHGGSLALKNTQEAMADLRHI